MSDKCYHCGVNLADVKATVEHIPAQNLYVGYGEEYKRNRLTVPACEKCNNQFSKIDQEIRDLLGIAASEENETTRKAVRSIMRKSTWIERAEFDPKGHVRTITFSYDDLKDLHIKNFKGVFYRKWQIPLAKNYRIEIIADGDDEFTEHADVLYSLLTSEKEEWQVSGHQDIFKYIIKGIAIDHEKNVWEKTGDLNEANFIASVLVYHDTLGVVVVATKEEYLESQKEFYAS